MRLLGPILVFGACISPIAISAPVTLIATGSFWKYLDNGSDQSTGWRAINFDDRLWGSGPAQLGYGDGDEATTNKFGLDPNNKHTTYYYRHAFNVTNTAAFTNLLVRLRRDDGAVVYLNATEVFRSNMPTGAVTYTTLAIGTCGDDGTFFFADPVNSALLVNGTNVIAVEVHQSTNNSSDLSFDLELVGNFAATPVAAVVEPPIMEFRFNETGTTAPSTGTDAAPVTLRNGAQITTDLHSADQVGVSGMPSDRAFDNSASTGMGSDGVGGKGRMSDDDNVDGLLSLTLQGWLRTQSEPLNNLARLCTKQGSTSGFLLLGASSGTLDLEINNVGSTTDTAAWSEVGEWIFFAVTYDGTTSASNVRFYKATRSLPVTLVETRSLNQGRALENTNDFNVGNSGGTGVNRPFDGWLDNVRVFGSRSDDRGALSAAQLEYFRQRDVQNPPDDVRLGVAFKDAALHLSWPVYPGGFRLEATTNLAAAILWSAVTNSSSASNGQKQLTLPVEGPLEVFRLVRP